MIVIKSNPTKPASLHPSSLPRAIKHNCQKYYQMQNSPDSIYTSFFKDQKRTQTANAGMFRKKEINQSNLGMQGKFIPSICMVYKLQIKQNFQLGVRCCLPSQKIGIQKIEKVMSNIIKKIGFSKLCKYDEVTLECKSNNKTYSQRTKSSFTSKTSKHSVKLPQFKHLSLKIICLKAHALSKLQLNNCQIPILPYQITLIVLLNRYSNRLRRRQLYYGFAALIK